MYLAIGQGLTAEEKRGLSRERYRWMFHGMRTRNKPTAEYCAEIIKRWVRINKNVTRVQVHDAIRDLRNWKERFFTHRCEQTPMYEIGARLFPNEKIESRWDWEHLHFYVWEGHLIVVGHRYTDLQRTREDPCVLCEKPQPLSKMRIYRDDRHVMHTPHFGFREEPLAPHRHIHIRAYTECVYKSCREVLKEWDLHGRMTDNTKKMNQAQLRVYILSWFLQRRAKDGKKSRQQRNGSHVQRVA